MVKRRALSVAGILAASCAFSALLLAAGRPDLGALPTFVTIAVMTFIFITAITLTRAPRVSRLPPVRRALSLAVLGLAAAGVLVVELAFVAFTFGWPSGQDVDGDFVVKSWRSADIIGEPNPATRVLYFRGTRVTDYLSGYVHHPTRPTLIIYENFEEDGPGATYAFDGETSRTLRLGPPYGLPEPEQWSPDQAKLAWKIQDELYLFDVERWRVTRLTGNATSPQEPHSMNLGGWSPSSRRFAVIDYGRRSLPGWQSVVLLREWDAGTLSVRTIDCMPDGPDRRAWQATDFTWQDDSLAITDTGIRDVLCPDDLQ